MKAVGMHQFGGPEVLEIVEVPTPHAGPGQVRIRVRAFAVNPADVMLRDGRLADWYADGVPPFVPGMEVAGVVDEVGPDAGDVTPIGTRVVAVVDNDAEHGGYSEYVALAAASVVAAPAGATFAEAASFPMTALTARSAINGLSLRPGSTLLVTGGAGAVGGYAIELASQAGIRVVAVGSIQDEQLLHSLGAVAVVARGAGAAAGVRALVPDGVDALIDAATIGTAIIPALRDGGRAVFFRPLDRDPGRGITVVPVNVREHVTDQAALTELRDLAEAKQLTLRVADVLPATDAAEAHRRLERGGVRGRLVLEWSTTSTTNERH